MTGRTADVHCCVSAGTVQVSVSAADVELEDGSSAKRKSRPSSLGVREKQLVAQLNVELLETTLIEVRNLRKVASSVNEPRSLERRKTLLHSIRQLTKYRREITDVFEGSVIFGVRCRTIRALSDLWTLCLSGRLRDALRTDFVTDSLLAKHHLQSFDFVVSFSDAEYQICLKELSEGLFLNLIFCNISFTVYNNTNTDDNVCYHGDEVIISSDGCRHDPKSCGIVPMRFLAGWHKR